MTDICEVCGTRIIVVDSRVHPSCEFPEARITMADRLKWAGQRRAVESAPNDHKLALAIIKQAAETLPVLSVNDLRSNPSWEQLHGPTRGAAVTTAIRRGWLRQVAFDASSSTATHGHRVGRYESTLYRAAS
jgi:hypothetical protein